VVSGNVGPVGYLYQLCVPWYPGPAPTGCTVSVTGPGGSASEGEASLAPPRPNPTASGARLAFTTPRAQRAILVVSGFQRARVRRSGEDGPAAGERSLVWDGRDDAGRSLPPGLYTVRLLVDGVSTRAARNVLLMR